ncbi:F-box/kelch-repeat protein At3g06240-like [Rutidosis leptorrhynchoides]|uniref:F-box/kelch-repeat protein At3g06240-like n=1 Tax=Rutidosis leptorrhynchoides TaxID=125765 RepID=UPI003A99EA0A
MSDPKPALNHLPSDLIEEILPLLPPKSLGRFKSVSKRWYSLISGPNFIKTHIRIFTENNPNPDPTHMILGPGDNDSFYSLDIKQLNTQTTLAPKRLNIRLNIPAEQCVAILGSCNGLVLAHDVRLPDNYYLLNPTTRKSLKVPDSGVERIGDTLGFGYDSSKDDYKVILILRISFNCTSALVYSLRNNSWNKLSNFPYLLCDHGRGVLINNNLHWVVKSRHSTLTIVAFNLASEELREIELPDYDCRRRPTFFLYVFGERLCILLHYWLNHDNCDFELWVMEEYGVPKSWTKFCIFEYDSDFEFIAQISNWAILLGDYLSGEICIYNMNERRCTSLKIEGHTQRLMVNGTYVESLESL